MTEEVHNYRVQFPLFCFIIRKVQLTRSGRETETSSHEEEEVNK